MSLFDRLFRKDPRAEIARGEELLAAGRAYEAIHAVRRAEAAPGFGDDPALRERARQAERRAREVLVASALAEADLMEADEEYDEAVDWVDSALEHLEALARAGAPDPGRAEALRRRRKALRDRRRDAGRQSSLLRRFEEDGEAEGPDPLDVETRFGLLAGTLHEEVADLYLHRPLPFQKAYVDLNEGRFADALAVLDALAAENPDDPVVRLERGRCRLETGDPEGAREDFDAAWPAFGDEPLDEAGELSVPALRAEAERLAGGAEAGEAPGAVH